VVSRLNRAVPLKCSTSSSRDDGVPLSFLFLLQLLFKLVVACCYIVRSHKTCLQSRVSKAKISRASLLSVSSERPSTTMPATTFAKDCDSKRIESVQVYQAKLATGGKRNIRFYNIFFLFLYLYQTSWVVSTVGEPYRRFLEKADREGFQGELSDDGINRTRMESKVPSSHSSCIRSHGRRYQTPCTVDTLLPGPR
jgi:hypothetical protein